MLGGIRPLILSQCCQTHLEAENSLSKMWAYILEIKVALPRRI